MAFVEGVNEFAYQHNSETPVHDVSRENMFHASSYILRRLLQGFRTGQLSSNNEELKSQSRNSISYIS